MGASVRMVDVAMLSLSSRRVVLGASLGVVLIALSARHASAQDIVVAPTPPIPNPLGTAITASDPLFTLPPIDFFREPDHEAGVATPPSKRPAALIPLYASFASLQVFDVTSTLRAIDRGAHEANPVVALVDSTPALAAMKAGSTMAVIYLAERLRKRHRIAAVLLMAGLNAGYVGVVTHNYSVSRR